MECPQCNRQLPPNEICMYCGSLDASGTARYVAPSFLRAWGKFFFRVVLPLAFLGFIAFLALTDKGRGWVLAAADAVGIRFTNQSDAIQLLKEQVPEIDEIEDSGSMRYEEEDQGDGIIFVTAIYKIGSGIRKAEFSVDLTEREVEARNFQAERLME